MAGTNRNLFRITRFILLKIPSLFGLLAKFRKPKKRLLIMKTDAIGDYVLFRNFIEIVRKSEKYRGYRIDLLGNSLWRDLAENYDKPFVDEFFFTDPEALYYEPLKALSLGWMLFKLNYAVVLQPTYARTFITDGLAALTAGKEIIGFDGDTERITPKYKIRTDKFYTQLVQLPNDKLFEFYRCGFYFETLLDSPIKLKQPTLPIKKTDRKGIVIFPGAGVSKRCWPMLNFLELIKRLLKYTDEPIYLAGGATEISTGNYLDAMLQPGSVINIINKTTLLQLTELVGSASLVISNETSAIHIAAATQTNSVCVLGGGHFDRFAPYPVQMVHRTVCVYEKMDCYRCNWNCKFKTETGESYPCIGNITVEAVWQAVQPFIATM